MSASSMLKFVRQRRQEGGEYGDQAMDDCPLARAEGDVGLLELAGQRRCVPARCHPVSE